MDIKEAKTIVKRAGYSVRESIGDEKRSDRKVLADFVEKYGGPDKVGIFGIQNERGTTGYLSTLTDDGVTIYPYYEYDLPDGGKYCSLQGGWGVKKDQIKSLLDLLDKVDVEDIPERNY
jgi:hypothetical protein